MKKLAMFMSMFLILLPIVLACGERDVKLVDNIDEVQTRTVKSACSNVNVEVDENNVVLVEKSRIKIGKEQAEEILQNYITSNALNIEITEEDHSDVKGHENHNHAAGRLQDSHGSISYAFLVRGDGSYYGGKSIPLYVDAEKGVVYGVGCGYGAGEVVYKITDEEFKKYTGEYKFQAFFSKIASYFKK
jgi:hypothetical protein